MPLNFGRIMKRVDRKVRESGETMTDWLYLSDEGAFKDTG